MMYSFCRRLISVLSFTLPPSSLFLLKNFLLRRFCNFSLGDNVSICSPFDFYGNTLVRVGNDTRISQKLSVYSTFDSKIIIEDLAV